MSNTDDTDNHDAARIASRFLDLWQEQMRLMATDPQNAEIGAQVMKLWTANPMMSAFFNPCTGGSEGNAGEAAYTRAEGPAPAAATSECDSGILRELSDRMGSLEGRLERIERLLAAQGPSRPAGNASGGDGGSSGKRKTAPKVPPRERGDR